MHAYLPWHVCLGQKLEDNWCDLALEMNSGHWACQQVTLPDKTSHQPNDDDFQCFCPTLTDYFLMRPILYVY